MKQGFERKLAALLFVMVLVVFSFAERDSRKLAKLYNASQVLRKSSQPSSTVAVKSLPKATSNN